MYILASLIPLRKKSNICIVLSLNSILLPILNTFVVGKDGPGIHLDKKWLNNVALECMSNSGQFFHTSTITIQLQANKIKNWQL